MWKMQNNLQLRNSWRIPRNSDLLFPNPDPSSLLGTWKSCPEGSTSERPAGRGQGTRGSTNKNSRIPEPVAMSLGGSSDHRGHRPGTGWTLGLGRATPSRNAALKCRSEAPWAGTPAHGDLVWPDHACHAGPPIPADTGTPTHSCCTRRLRRPGGRACRLSEPRPPQPCLPGL